jgi:hypothetical protein
MLVVRSAESLHEPRRVRVRALPWQGGTCLLTFEWATGPDPATNWGEGEPPPKAPLRGWPTLEAVGQASPDQRRVDRYPGSTKEVLNLLQEERSPSQGIADYPAVSFFSAAVTDPGSRVRTVHGHGSQGRCTRTSAGRKGR